MDIDKKTLFAHTDIEAALSDTNALNNTKEENFFSGSITLERTNSAFVFNFVNAETLKYILNEAKSYGEVTIEIFRHDASSEALQQEDSPRHNL